MSVQIPYPFGGRAELVAASWDETKHPREAKGQKGGGRFTVLYRSIPAPLSGPSQFGPGDPGWDDPVAQVEANLVDWPGLGHTWGTEAVATHYSTEGSMTVGVEWPEGVGEEEQNGVVIPAGVPGRLVSMTVHTADGPVPLDVPEDLTVRAAEESELRASADCPFCAPDELCFLCLTASAGRPDVEMYNRAAKRAVHRLEAHVPELQRVYESEFRAGMDWAADQLVKLTAAAPPEPDGILNPDQAAITAEATKIARRRALLMFLDTLGVNLSLANPMVQQLVFDLGRFAGRLMVPGLKEAVSDSLKRSYAEGLSVPDAAEQLREVGVKQAPWRAEMMARTDLNGLANGGSLAGAQLIYPDGTVAKRWLSAHDDRVRPDHVEADGQVVPLEQAFQVGDDLLQHPGDPAGSDAETCNCRCTVVYVPLEQALAAAGWVADQHPRHPAGTHQGGKFRTAQQVADKAQQNGVRMSVSEYPDALVLNMIASDQHGEGHASAALDDLSDYADSTGKPVFLTPEAVGQGGLSTVQLERWYRRHGFEALRRRDGRRQEHTHTLVNEPSVTADGWDESQHPRDPGGDGGGEFVPKGTASTDEPSEFWKKQDYQWPKAMEDWHTFTKEDVLTGKVPGIVAAETLRDGAVAAHARDRDITVSAESETAFQDGHLSTFLMSHEAGHYVANEIQREFGMMSIPELEPFRTDTRLGYQSPWDDYADPGSYVNEPGEILADTYANLLNASNTFDEPEGEYAVTRRALLDRVARTAKKLGLPSGQVWRAESKQVKGKWVYKTVRASAVWDEAAHPRDPGGEGGGEFIPKGSTAPGAKLPKKPKLIDAGELKYELDEMWYGTTDHPLAEKIGDWDSWTPQELELLRAKLVRELSEGQYGPTGWESSGLLSVKYSKEIARSMAKPRAEARTLVKQLDKWLLIDHIERFDLDPEDYPELFPVKAEPRPKAPDPRSQGVPDIYLSESGKFKPGFDAKLKSDLVASALDHYPTKVGFVSQEPTRDLKHQVAEYWRGRNPAEAAERQWTDDDLWPLAKSDPELPYDIRKEITRTVGTRQTRKSTLTHRFAPDEARRILEERGWGKYLDDGQKKLGVGGRILSRSEGSQALLDAADRNWGDALVARGTDYSKPTTYKESAGTFGPGITKRLVDQNVTVHVGSGASTDQDQLQHYNEQGRMSTKGWGNNKMDKAGGFYTSSERKVAAGTAGRDGSANVVAHEIGHAIGHTLGVDSNPELREWHGRLHSRLHPYYQQGPKYSEQGVKELWAEGTAMVQEGKRREAVGLPPLKYNGVTRNEIRSGVRDPDVDEYYGWVARMLDDLERQGR